jgi:hypothetical protein
MRYLEWRVINGEKTLVIIDEDGRIDNNDYRL